MSRNRTSDLKISSPGYYSLPLYQLSYHRLYIIIDILIYIFQKLKNLKKYAQQFFLVSLKYKHPKFYYA